MCLYLHTDMYVEHINTRGHERICPYQILEKNTYNSLKTIKQTLACVCTFHTYIHRFYCKGNKKNCKV